MLSLKTVMRRRTLHVLALAVAGAMLIGGPRATAANNSGAEPPASSARNFVSPELAAQRLYGAWRQGNRRAALKVATRGAVNTLFSNRWRDWGPMKFKGCERNDGGTIICRYVGRKSGVLEMGVEGGASVGGYNVDSVSLFSAND